MGISSLGVGSGILTQDIIDQLKAADKQQFIDPKNAKIKVEDKKIKALNIIDALMDNVSKSFDSLTGYGLFEKRTASITGGSIAVKANDNIKEQSFTLDVKNLATKEIDESGSFSSKTAKIADDSGSVTFNVDDEDFTIDYDDATTLEAFKDAINEKVGGYVKAKIVEVADGDFRLLINSNKTGASHDISITDNDGNLKGTQLTDDLDTVQDGVDAKFVYDGAEITRSSNDVDNLIEGVSITLKKTGASTVKISQDRENITKKINNFVEKYNSAMFQLNIDTKSSQKSKDRGVFSDDSAIKGMRRELKNMLSTVGEGVGRIDDYGLSLDKDGRLKLDDEKFNQKLDENPENVKAFFAGGTFVKNNGTKKELEGVFSKMQDISRSFSRSGGILTQERDGISERMHSLEKQKTIAQKRLDARYEIMSKRFAAYDNMISKINAASTMFVQLANSEMAAAKK